MVGACVKGAGVKKEDLVCPFHEGMEVSLSLISRRYFWILVLLVANLFGNVIPFDKFFATFIK
tara:strand:+ start:1231 stop:1419 length:189 start_codon:yes stop_codon:yes gene_type:complete